MDKLKTIKKKKNLPYAITLTVDKKRIVFLQFVITLVETLVETLGEIVGTAKISLKSPNCS